MKDYSESRNKMISSLVSEVFGPEVIKEPIGLGIDPNNKINFEEKDKYNRYLPHYDNVNDQEILVSESPRQKYGAGVIFPFENTNSQSLLDDEIPLENVPIENINEDKVVSPKAMKDAIGIKNNKSKGATPGEISDEEFDLSGSNIACQTSFGISFHCEIPKNSKIVISNPNVPCGVYQEKDIYIDDIKQDNGWWVRKNILFNAEFDSNSILSNDEITLKPTKIDISSSSLILDFILRVRTSKENKKIITACIINKTENSSKIDSNCLFQAGFIVKILNDKKDILSNFYPYPKGEIEEKIAKEDEEEQVLDLIYRNNQTFAIGHGCSATWTKGDQNAAEVEAKFLPIFDSPNITPVIERDNGETFEIPMNVLAGVVEGDWINLLKELTTSYEKWITNKKKNLQDLDKNFHDPGNANLAKCDECLSKMKKGIEFLENDKMAEKAFKWMNESILTQQLRSSWESKETKKKKREPQWDKNNSTWFFPDQFEAPDLKSNHKSKGKWRPFQLAFILSTIKSTVLLEDEDREEVELIFFPTGGGKTEAYLGLSAFTSFYKRLIDPNDAGVNVIMRYTLRLLTAQQFTRASSLICAMEKIRENYEEELGKTEFSIGVWVGSASTPNKMKGSASFPGAMELYSKLIRGSRDDSYKFLITKCPWCSAHIGKVKTRETRAPKCIGLKTQGERVIFRCKAQGCDFNKPLPIYVVDEDIYQKRPTILIATVDKFAQLTWEKESKKIFGIDSNGQRISSPPSIILQDELHLITGPLGSMYGLYEVVVEELCTFNKNGKKIKPKIVCSTATIRSYKRQIKDLYNRDKINLFPPLGLEVEDSFFSKYALDDHGNYLKPKKYLGLLTTNYSSIQTAQVRIYSRLLYSARKLDLEETDPWFTLMSFFGSLRELGNTTTLIQVDIIDQINRLIKRYNDDPKTFSKIDNILELTSRVKSEEIPLAIDKLETKISTSEKEKTYPVDICLASNIIEVGIDIDRLSLLTILGQPKTTSSYIQVSGRIGRNWFERPGLVCTLYGFRRPRDKSHFEKFTSYHQRLYAQVEPMSVTPFARPVLERALHGILVAYVRCFGDINISERPREFPTELINSFTEIIRDRIKEIDIDELESFDNLIKKCSNEWKRWDHDRYTSRGTKETDIGLMYPAGSYVSLDQKDASWPTPNSMRQVDMECNASITNLYRATNEENVNG